MKTIMVIRLSVAVATVTINPTVSQATHSGNETIWRTLSSFSFAMGRNNLSTC